MRKLPTPRARGVPGQRGFIVLGTLLTLGLAALAVLALGALLLALAALWYWNDLPALDKATDYRPRQHLLVLTSDGAEIAQFGSERRVFVPMAKMPARMKQAVLAVEDTGFYEHKGISFRGLARATLSNLTGGAPQGASTLTQQVARTFFLSTRRTAERKINLLTDANDASIVRTIVALAQSFSLDVVAEGVETDGQRDFLLQLGCSHFQGYLFGRPVPIDLFPTPRA